MNIDSLIYITSVLTKCQPTLYASRLVYSSLLSVQSIFPVLAHLVLITTLGVGDRCPFCR